MTERSNFSRVIGYEVRALGIAVAFACAVFVGVLGIGPHTGRYRVATVLSGSMRPTYPPGSIVFATPIDCRAIRVGDVIMHQAGTTARPVVVVAHRVVDVSDSGDGVTIRTKGDANEAPDPWSTRIEGEAWRIRTSVEGAGFAIHALRGRRAQTVLSRVVPALLTLTWLIAVWRPVPHEA